MRQILNIDHKNYAKKSLGQNFIHNKFFLKKLSDLIETDNNTDIIEIGPGKGALTEFLIKKEFGTFYMIEKDNNLYHSLKDKYKDDENIKIFNFDALKFDYEKILGSKKVIIVGNLPFNISSQLLIKWISVKKWPPFYSKMYLMFQSEVGKRIIANKDSNDYGKISVLVQSRCDVKKIAHAPSNIFHPKPKVNGLVIEFIPSKKYQDVDFEILQKITKSAFEKRRKKIKNSLDLFSEYFEDWDEKKDLRPENLEVDDYCVIARKIN